MKNLIVCIVFFLCVLLTVGVRAEERIQIVCDSSSCCGYPLSRFFSRVILPETYVYHNLEVYKLHSHNIFPLVRLRIVSWIDRFYMWFVIPAAIGGIMVYIIRDMNRTLRRREED